MYPGTGFAKGQLIEYYSLIAPVMLPHVRDRPLTMKRYPNGVEGSSFFEKHAPRHAPEWIRQVSVPSSEDGGSVDYSVICGLADLVWAANLATIKFSTCPCGGSSTGAGLPGPARSDGVRPRPR